MAGFFIICGLICAVVAAPIYSLVMLWLNRWQRFYVAALIGMLLLLSSAQILKAQQLGQLSLDHLLSRLIADPRVPFFLALTVGWLICGFFHAIISLCRGWGSEQSPDAAPHTVQD
jgi:hypothetical protein